MAEEKQPEHLGGMVFMGDQDEWEAMPQAMRDHMWAAMMHKAGLGPHPGKYKGPKHEPDEEDVVQHSADPTEGELARLREEMEAPPEEKGPTPPEEALPPQPPLQGGGGKPAPKPPSKGTPAALGQEAVQPPPPQGEF